MACTSAATSRSDHPQHQTQAMEHMPAATTTQHCQPPQRLPAAMARAPAAAPAHQTAPPTAACRPRCRCEQKWGICTPVNQFNVHCCPTPVACVIDVVSSKSIVLLNRHFLNSAGGAGSGRADQGAIGAVRVAAGRNLGRAAEQLMAAPGRMQADSAAAAAQRMAVMRRGACFVVLQQPEVHRLQAEARAFCSHGGSRRSGQHRGAIIHLAAAGETRRSVDYNWIATLNLIRPGVRASNYNVGASVLLHHIAESAVASNDILISA